MDNIFIGGKIEPSKVEVQEKPEKKDDSSLHNVPDITPPLTEYESLKGHPYSVDFFNIDFWGALTQATDVDNVKGNIKQIEQYVQGEIASRKLENTTGSYHEIINEITLQMSLSPNEQVENKLIKVSKYIKLINLQREFEEKSSKIRKQIFG